VASSDLVNMGITVVSYTLKDIRDDEVRKKERKKERKADVKNKLIADLNNYLLWKRQFTPQRPGNLARE
jgi:hypothetical protein